MAILSRHLTPEEYAVYRQTFLCFQVLTPFLAMGFNQGVLYFIPREPEKAAKIVTEMCLGVALISLLVALLLWTAGADYVAVWMNNPALVNALKWAAIFPAVALPAGLMSPILIAAGKSRLVPGLSAFQALLILLCIGGALYFFGNEALVLVQARVVAAVVVFVVFAILIIAIIPIRKIECSFDSYKTLVSYSYPLALASGVAILNKNIDKVLVSIFESPAEAAVFINGAMEIPLISVVTGSVAGILAAEFSKKYSEGKYEDILRVWKRGTEKVSLILIPGAALLWFFSEECMVLLYGEQYKGSAEPFRVYLLLIPLRVMQGGLFLRVSGHTKVILWFSIGICASNAVLTTTLVHLYGMIGAAWGTVITIGVIGFPVGLYLTQRFTGLPAWKYVPLKFICMILFCSICIAKIAHYIFTLISPTN